MSNVVPALVIALISQAYLEEDGLLLSIALCCPQTKDRPSSRYFSFHLVGWLPPSRARMAQAIEAEIGA
jgi:hypothetical protein